MKEKKSLKIRKPRVNLKSSRVRYGGYNVVVAVVVLAILIAVNLLVTQLPSKYMKIDTSGSSVYSLGGTTEQVVGNLADDVTIYVLAQESAADSVLVELLNRYEDLSDRLHVEYIDTAKNPSFASQYGASTASSGSLVVVSDRRYTLVDYSDIYEVDVDYYTYYTTGEYDYTTTFDGEGLITSAIDYVTTDTLPILYALSGHGEADLSDDMVSQVNKMNIEIESLNLMEQETIPEDAAALLVNQPSNDLSEGERDLILEYLRDGGSLLYIPVLAMDGTTLDNFNEILDYYGMSLTGTLVVEGDSTMYYQYPDYLLPAVSDSSEITSPIAEAGISMLIPDCQAIRISDDLRSSLTVTELVATSEEAYAKDLTGGSISAEKEAGDEEGPFVLAASAEEETDGDSVTRVVVIASEYLLDDSILASYSVSNADLFLNSASWMCGHESTISISAKDLTEATLVVDTASGMVLQFVTMILLPVGLLAAGFIVWFWRRKK